MVERRAREESIAFAVNRVRGPDPKGTKSIKIYGLNRYRLAQDRMKMIERFRAQLRLIERAWEASLSKPPADAGPAREQARQDLREALEMYASWDAPYSSACRAFYENWKAELLERLRRQTSAITAVSC